MLKESKEPEEMSGKRETGKEAKPLQSMLLS